MRTVLTFSLLLTIACHGVAAQTDSAPSAHVVPKAGLTVVLGCRKPERLTALHREKRLVHALGTAPEQVENVRNHIAEHRLYGTVSAHLFDGKRLPYADSLVNLIVVSDETIRTADGKDAWAAYSADTGNELARIKLPYPPTWDGMAATNGHLHLSLADGSLVCLGEGK